MNRRKISIRLALCGLLASGLTAASALAQCDPCATPTVAYQPVQTVAYQSVDTSGWYPGKLLDRWRMRRWSATAAATAAPVYSASYAPTTYSASYAPASTYTASYRPYVTSYAPLSYPRTQTVSRQVVMSPVSSACSVCECSPCSCPTTTNYGSSSCPSYPTGVSQASYSEAPCTDCAPYGGSSYAEPTFQSGPSTQSRQPSGSQTTPQPTFEPPPSDSDYRSERPSVEEQPQERRLESQEEDYPGPAGEEETNTTFDFDAPRLLSPTDRQARSPRTSRPTIDVWTAVHRSESSPATTRTTHTTQKPAKTQAEIDAEGWMPVR